MTNQESVFSEAYPEAVHDTLERAMTRVHFDRLLEFATAVCLRAPLDSVEVPAPTLESELVRKCGALGLRTALELIDEVEVMGADADEERSVRLDAPLREGERFADWSDPEIIARVTQFGKQLIDEAFTVLGEDADSYVEKMKVPERESQTEALKWLAGRIMDLKEDKERHRFNDDYGSTFYHPARLSPKLIGTYPDTLLAPTCLGASVLAASFFERAGVEYMHAGVMEGSGDRHIRDLAITLEGYESVLGAEHTLLREVVEGQTDKMISTYLSDNGYHAAILAHIAGDIWLQFDPYMHAFDDLDGVMGDRCAAVKNALDSYSELAPQLQLTVSREYKSVMEVYVQDAMGLRTDMYTDEDWQAQAYDMMISREHNPKAMYDTLIKPILRELFAKVMRDRELSQDTYEPFCIELLGGETDELDESEIDMSTLHMVHVHVSSPAEAAFRAMYAKYVEWGYTREEVADRMGRDPEYAARRMQDMTTLPHLVCLELMQQDVRGELPTGAAHEAMEVGLPHTRIGFSVLHDFAVYFDDALPPSFWAANWSSLAVTSEYIDRDANTSRQIDMLVNHAEYQDERYLTYIKSRVKLRKFMQEYVERNDDVQKEESGGVDERS